MVGIPELSWQALAAMISAGEPTDGIPIVVISSNSNSNSKPEPSDVALVRSAPIVTVTVGGVATRDANEEAESTDLRVLESELDAVAAAVRANPQSATTLALLVRLTEGAPVLEAIHAESLAYATLQAGAEFARWLSSRGPATPPEPAESPVLTHTENGNTRVLLNRPESANAVDRSLRHALTMTFSALAYSGDPIVLAGVGRNFCSGGDLREFGLAASPATAHGDRMRANLPFAVARVASRLTAEVHGACIGAGLELSSFAARVVAAPDTSWRLPEVSMGLLPGCGGTVSVPRRIGRQRFLEWALTGEEIGVDRALDWGLIDEIGIS